MRIFVKVKPSSKEDRVEKEDDNHFTVFVKERPIKGQANRGVVRVLAGYFKVSRSDIRIVSGLTSAKKAIEIYGRV